MSIRDYYQGIIRDIMQENDVYPPLHRPEHAVSKNAGLEDVLQYTDYYIGKGNDTRPASQEHYRYRRYEELLNYFEPSSNRVSHVDLGCGPGLFSWVFLDWASQNDIDHKRVALYGLDHSPAMICLAREIRTRLKPYASSYPELHYSHKIKRVLRKLRNNYKRKTDYVITFGHVLAQAHAPDDVKGFARIIVEIVKLMDAQSDCVVLAVDADSAAVDFAEGWSALLQRLESAKIRHDEHKVPTTYINDSGRAKIAWLCPKQ